MKKEQPKRTDDLRMQIRFTAAEREHLEAQAAAAGMTCSALLRHLAAGCVLRTAADQQALSEVTRAGRLVKKIWSEGAPSDATRSALWELELAARRIAAHL